MVWTRDAGRRREIHKIGRKMTKRKTPNQMNRPNYKGYRNKRRKLEEIKKTGIERKETVVIIDPYLWK